MKLEERIQVMLPVLNERQRRLFLASEARKCRGGVKRISNLSGVSEKTIRRGLLELAEGGARNLERVRRPGGGRKPLCGDDQKISMLVSRITKGDILSYTLLGRKAIVRELESKHECKVSVWAVERAFQNLGYKKSSASVFPTVSRRFLGISRQLDYIDSTAQAFQQNGNPVIFVDGQKRSLSPRLLENCGDNSIDLCETGLNLKNLMPGHAANPRKFQQNVTYVKSSREYERLPGSIIEAIAAWWDLVGNCSFPKANQLFMVFNHPQELLFRENLWKYHLFQFAMAQGIEIYVAFLPCGRYRWRWRQAAHILYHIVCEEKNGLIVDTAISTVIPRAVCPRHLERECHTISEISWLYKLTPAIFDTVDIRENGFCKNFNFSIHGFKKEIVDMILRAEKGVTRGRYDLVSAPFGAETVKQQVRRVIDHVIRLITISVGRPLELIFRYSK